MGPEWSLYERLLAELPEDERVSACLVGSAWTLVKARGVGMAMSFHDDTWQSCTTSPIAGRALAEVASGLTSWELTEAAIGLAALNAHYNQRERVEQWLGRRIGDTEDSPVFRSLEDEVAGQEGGGRSATFPDSSVSRHAARSPSSNAAPSRATCRTTPKTICCPPWTGC